MNIYSFLQIIAGLAFFLYGMSVMSSSLEKMAGGQLEKTMKAVTSNKLMGFLLGALITIAIQSSSGAMVMLIGLVNSGIINYGSTLPIILGTNVGTTLTGWILTLTGIETDGFTILSIFKPDFLSPVCAFLGIILRMAGKREKQKDIGTIMIGFALLMYGMTFMSDSMKAMADEPWFANIIIMFTNPILALLIATVFTGIIQSSAATIGIIEAFAAAGSITYHAAIPLILGANIGTCITSVISSIGTSKNAKRVSLMSVIVKVASAAIVLASVFLFESLTTNNFLLNNATSVHIALIHTLFNIIATLLSIPFSKLIINLARAIIKTDDADLPEILIDERLIAQPTIAINECLNYTMEMAKLARDELKQSLPLITKYDPAAVKHINELENKVDWYQDQLDSYLIKLSKVSLSEKSSEDINKMFHLITDFERIGDHGINICKLAGKMDDAKMTFSPEAMSELNTLFAAINEILDYAVDSFTNDDLASAAQVEPLEQAIDNMISTINNNHIDRLRKGECTIEPGLVLSDLLINCERVSDHCSNIAVCLIEVADDEFYTHHYLDQLKKKSGDFQSLLDYYTDRYRI